MTEIIAKMYCTKEYASEVSKVIVVGEDVFSAWFMYYYVTVYYYSTL